MEVPTTVEQGLLAERMELVVRMELELVAALAAAARLALDQVRKAPPAALVAVAVALEP
jgi:hypothetical protein